MGDVFNSINSLSAVGHVFCMRVHPPSCPSCASRGCDRTADGQQHYSHALLVSPSARVERRGRWGSTTRGPGRTTCEKGSGCGTTPRKARSTQGSGARARSTGGACTRPSTSDTKGTGSMTRSVAKANASTCRTTLVPCRSRMYPHLYFVNSNEIVSAAFCCAQKLTYRFLNAAHAA
jgi:hypothetical protein